MADGKSNRKAREKALEAGRGDPRADAFAAAIGASCASARAKRGMTRRQLAEQSGASERYLAQIESGQGNPSVIVLKAIADALDVPIIELLPRTDGRSEALDRIVDLLRRLPPSELPGDRRADRRPGRCARDRPGATDRAGRAARRRQVDARRAARRRARRPFIELNRLVEQEYGASIPDLIEIAGHRHLPPLRARLPRTRHRRARGGRHRDRRRHRVESRKPTRCCCAAPTRSGSRRGPTSTCAA